MNNYILEYYQAITDGTEAAGAKVKKAYEIIVKGLEDKTFFYAPKKAKAAIVFIEHFCRHHEGALAPGRIKLELWQKAFISVIFGIVDAEGFRQFREVILVVARKNGKTLLAAAICAYHNFVEGEYGARTYMTAPKLEQANLCFEAFYQMVKTEPELNRLARKRRTDIYIENTNATIKALAFNAQKSDGLNISLGICDEVSSWAGDRGLKFYEVLKSSMGARREPLLLSITTAGYINDGVYDELRKRATQWLNGTSSESRLFALLYEIDDPEKWNDINELRKSNPNLGVSVSVNYLLEEIAVAEGSLPKKAEFLTKYCNVKQNSSQAWIRATDVENSFNGPLHFEDYARHYAVLGLDLSQTTDLTAGVCVIEKDGKLNVFTQFWMPSARIEDLTARDGLPYRAYVQRGFLRLSGENFVDYHDVEQWFKDLITKYKIYGLKLGYDRFSAQYLIQDLSAYGYNVDDVYQGENLTPVINEVDGLIRDGVFEFGDNDLMKVHILNSALKINNETNRKKLIKISAEQHIDGMAALLDAMCVRQKWYAEIGGQLKNDKRKS